SHARAPASATSVLTPQAACCPTSTAGGAPRRTATGHPPQDAASPSTDPCAGTDPRPRHASRAPGHPPLRPVVGAAVLVALLPLHVPDPAGGRHRPLDRGHGHGRP